MVLTVSLFGIHYSGFIPLASLLLTAYSVVLLLLGRPDGRRLLRLALTLVAVGWLVYWVPFVTLDFSLHEVFWNTSPGLPLWMRFAAAWAGGGGSLFLFALIASLATLYLMRGEPSNKLLAVAAATVAVGLAAAFLNDAFTVLPTRPASGAGLNPLLKSPWLYPHPLSTFTGYALLAVAAAAIALGERRRGLILFELGWAALTVGILLGGYWSYETFGWGGYWAWDPVETSELMVWLAATLLPHLLPLAPSYAAPLSAYMASSVFLAMYVTRTGLSPLHSFAAASIGALTLLASALAWAGFGLATLYSRLETGWREYVRSVRSLDTYKVGLAVAAVALAAASLFVYGTLLTPSLLVAVGKQVSVPQMASGIRYFHPVLYPLLIVMLAALPAVFLGKWMGWRGYAALAGTVAIAAASLGLAAYTGKLTLAPLTPRTTNAMMAFGLPWAAAAASAAAAYVILRGWRRAATLPRDRLAWLALLHLGLAVTVIGVLLSGTYAFNESYMRTYHLKPGETIELPNGYKLTLLGYSYGISDSMVDIYTRYVGRVSSYYYGQIALKTLASDLARAVRAYMLGARLVAENSTARCLAELAQVPAPIPLDANYTIEANATVELVDFASNTTLTIALDEPVRIRIEGGSVRPVLSSDPHTGKPVLFTPMQALNVTISFERNISAFLPPVLGIHQIPVIRFEKPVTVRAGNVTLELYNVTISSAALWGSAPRNAKEYLLHVRGNSIYGKLAIVDVIAGTVSCSGSKPARIPAELSEELAAYLAARNSPIYSRLLRALNETGLYRLLEKPEEIAKLAEPKECRGGALMAGRECIAYVRAPKLVPETAWLDVTLRVGHGDSYHDVRLRVRFEAYGEVQGIHGLVPKVIHPGMGLDEVYIVVSPPTVESFIHGSSIVYHELLIYYLHEAYKRLSPEERLALTAVMIGGYMKDVVEDMIRSGQLAQAQLLLEDSLVDVYLLASKFDPANSTIAREGLEVKVKIVPGVRLVWAGPIVMGLSAVALAALAAVQSRGRREAAG